jgi:hypothetical protein
VCVCVDFGHALSRRTPVQKGKDLILDPTIGFSTQLITDFLVLFVCQKVADQDYSLSQSDKKMCKTVASSNFSMRLTLAIRSSKAIQKPSIEFVFT